MSLWMYQHGITRAWLWEPPCASAGVSAWYHLCVALGTCVCLCGCGCLVSLVHGSGSPCVSLRVYLGITRAWLWEPACVSVGVSAWYDSCMALGACVCLTGHCEHHFPIVVFSHPLSRQHLRGLVVPRLPVLGSTLLLYFSLLWDSVMGLICISLVFQLLRTSFCDE